MAVSPADFELYSRATGTPLPRTPQEQMQMAPQVYQFIQNRGYQNPQGFLGQAGEFLAKAALVGGGLALANKLIPYESRNEVSGVQKPTAKRASLYAPSPTTDSISTGVVEKAAQTPAVATPERVIDIVPGNVDQEGNPIKGLFEYEPENVGGVDRFGNVMPKGGVFGGKSNYFSPEGMYGGDPEMIGTVPSRRVRDEFSSSANIPQISEELVGNVGNVGSLTTNLANAVDRSDVWDSGAAPAVVVAGTRGFGPAPAPRAEAAGLRDIEFSMEPPIQRDPSFFNPTGNWGVGDTANLLGSSINFAMDYGPTIVEQGALDLAKGYRDIQKGIDDTSVVIDSVYKAGAATRQLVDNTISSLPTSSYQQSAPLETGDKSILIDHPDVSQEGTGSDEVQNNRNYNVQGNVDLDGEPTSKGGNIVTKLFDKAKAVWDQNTEIANEIAREDALIDEVRSAPPAGYEAYQRFDPRPAKKIPYISKVTGKPTGKLMDAGGGSGVEYIAITGDGDTELDIDWQSKNPEKTTPGGYRFNSYLDSTGTTYRDSLVDSIADPRITGGAIGDQGIGTTVSDEIMDEKHARDDLQDTNYETVKEWLDTGRFGYGEDQVSPGKFAQKAKKSQATLSDFIAENRDRLGGN